MKRNHRKLVNTLYRFASLRCPACGRSSIVERPFKIKHHCPSCRALFMREEGFFVGAIMANVVTTEGVILAAYLVGMLVIGLDHRRVLPALFVLAFICPLALYHHSWSAWLCIDFFVESLPKHHEP